MRRTRAALADAINRQVVVPQLRRSERLGLVPVIRSRVLARIALVLVLLAPATARAGDDDEVFLGNQAPLSGGAVTATVSDGAALVGVTLGLEHTKERRLAEGEDANALRFVSTYALRYALAVGDVPALLVERDLDATTLDALTENRIRAVTHELTLYVGSSLRF